MERNRDRTELDVMVLTGCASGIGAHLAGALARRGHRLIATDLEEGKLEEQARSGGWDPAHVRRRRLDVRSEADWEGALDAATLAWGRVDVLMNIAGFLRPGYVHELSTADIDLHLDVNVKGTVLGTRAAARRMIAQGSGHIVNFGSLASLAPVPGLCLYSASKFAVRGFSLAAASELDRHGVAVTLVMPDAVQTPMLDLQVSYDEAAMTFSGDRALTVEDIERLIVERVLSRRPMEVALPRGRGTLARFANAMPEATRKLAPLLIRKGLRAQRRRRRGNGRDET